MDVFYFAAIELKCTARSRFADCTSNILKIIRSSNTKCRFILRVALDAQVVDRHDSIFGPSDKAARSIGHIRCFTWPKRDISDLRLSGTLRRRSSIIGVHQETTAGKAHDTAGPCAGSS